MPFDFPSSPTENQEFTAPGGPTYIYRAPRWMAMTGPGEIPDSSSKIIWETVADAASAFHPVAIKALKTQSFAATPIQGGAHYARTTATIAATYPPLATFRSQDRFLADGTSDATEGGWWLLDERSPSALMFGLTAGTAADQSVFLQAAIDYGERAKVSVLYLPAIYIRLDNTIFIGRLNPIRIEGTVPHGFLTSTNNEPDDTAYLRFENLAVNSVAIDIGSGNPAYAIDGISLSNLAIARPTRLAAGLGGIGILMRGLTTPHMHNIVISGFDINWKITHTDSGNLPSSYGYFSKVRCRIAVSINCLLEMCKASTFNSCDFNGSVIGMKIVPPPLGNDIANGSRWDHCVFNNSGAGATEHLYNVHITHGFGWWFTNCDFEQAMNENFYANGSGSVWNVQSHMISICFLNCIIHNGLEGNHGALNIADMNFQIIGGMYYTDSLTDAAIKIGKTWTPGSIVELNSSIIGANITYYVVAGVDTAYADGLSIIGNNFVDYQEQGLPCVLFGANTNRSVVTGNRFRTTHPTGYVQAASGVGGNRFKDNVLTNNTAPEEYTSSTVGGPPQAVLGTTARQQLLGNSQSSTARAVAKYSPDTAAGFELILKSRSTSIGGARAAVLDGDDVYLRRYAVDDGSADVEVAREIVEVDGITGGRWSLFTRTAGGSLTQRLMVDQGGNTTFRVTALTAAATDGFVYIPGGNGPPTGVPTAKTGQVPVYVDTTNNKLYFYSGGAWRDAGP